MSELPLHDRHEADGAVFGDFAGWRVPRHYGDPAAEYAAATAAAAVIDRSYRARFRVGGRAPIRTIQGLVSNDIERPPEEVGEAILRGEAVYATILTPKGRIVADLRVLWRGPNPDDGLFLDLPAAGIEGTRAHFEKYVPPRFAAISEVTGETGMLAVAGPGAADALARALDGLLAGEGPEAEEIGALGEDRFLAFGSGEEGEIVVLATGEIGVPALEVVAPAEATARLRERLREDGVAPFGHGAWETLRIEAGRPRFGVDIDDATLPQEAGLGDRAISDSAGCYTGQEVVVRIRDRGHVNWNLRGILLGEHPAPPAETELWVEGRDRAAGRITSAVQSPRYGQAVALGYARREVEPPAEARLTGPDGERVRVVELTGPGWGES